MCSIETLPSKTRNALPDFSVHVLGRQARRVEHYDSLHVRIHDVVANKLETAPFLVVSEIVS